MLELLAKNWWTFTLRGIAAIVFGVLALLWPGITLLALIILFGAYAIVDGVLAIIAAIAPRQRQDLPHARPWWAYLLWGLLGIAAGIIAFLWPGITALALLYIIAFWAIVRGVMEIIAAIQLRRVITNEWLLILAGVLSIVIGIVLLGWPAAGALGLVWFIGFMSILLGAMLIGLSVRLKGVKNRLEARAAY